MRIRILILKLMTHEDTDANFRTCTDTCTTTRVLFSIYTVASSLQSVLSYVRSSSLGFDVYVFVCWTDQSALGMPNDLHPTLLNYMLLAFPRTRMLPNVR